MDSFYVVATCRAKSGHEDALRIILRAAVAPSQAEEGILSYILNEDIKAPGRFVFIEQYRDDAANQRHTQTAHFKTLFTQASPLIDGKFDIAMVRPVT